MSKFTKGKWKVKYNPMIQGIFDEDNKPVQLNEANARLIAAAPEMYTELKNLVKFVDAVVNNYSGLKCSTRCLEMLLEKMGVKELLAQIDGEVEHE